MTDRWERPVDIAWLAALRVAFGVLIAVSSVRFLANGWVDRFFVQPSFHFPYWGFAWLEVPPPSVMYAVFGALVLCGVLVALGLFYRPAIVATFVLFTYVELLDVTNYLNHYYLVSLEAFLLCWLPAHGAWSLDARRKPSLRRSRIPAAMLWLLRGQVALVYVYAGLAKAGTDWLVHGQPLDIWLSSRIDLPVLGPLFALPWAPLAMSWAGFLHDLLVVPALLWRRTRALAYAALVTFHLLTSALFPIGMFPIIMIVSATVFFDPSWPRRLLRGARDATTEGDGASPNTTRLPALARIAIAAWLVVQVAMPLRTHVYGGDVLWHEQGMRWSWRVMVREKNGAVTYRIERPDGREQLVPPSRYLTTDQEREMAGQPDLILHLGHVIGNEMEERFGQPIAVRVDALVSLNGRPPQALIDPDVDLMTLRRGIRPADWILPGPSAAPPRLRTSQLP